MTEESKRLAFAGNMRIQINKYNKKRPIAL